MIYAKLACHIFQKAEVLNLARDPKIPSNIVNEYYNTAKSVLVTRNAEENAIRFVSRTDRVPVAPITAGLTDFHDWCR